MKINRTLMDLMRSDWLISLEGLTGYAPIAHKIITGQSITIGEKTDALVSVFDSKGKRIVANDKGDVVLSKDSIAVVDMVGPMMKYGDWCSYGADDIVSQLQILDANPNIAGIVLKIDGPGGAVSAIGPFIDFGANKTKPVIALVDQCCSLHYWIACTAADYIMADNNVSATIGSVGVMTSFADNRKYLESLGYTFHDIYAPESEHKNEAFTLAREGKYDMIQNEHLSPLAIKFQEAVRSARPNLKEATGVLTGKTFGADKALAYGMIDAIGNIRQAMSRLYVMSETKPL
jgi:protease-4